MTELEKDTLKSLRSKAPTFKKEFETDIKHRHNDSKFRLKSFCLDKIEHNFLDFSFEYKGQCSLVPGDGKGTGKVKISDPSNQKAIFSAIEKFLCEEISVSYQRVS